MRIGICSWAFAESLRGLRPVKELAGVAQDAGFNSLEGVFNLRGFLGPNGSPPDRSLPIPLCSLATLQLHRFHLTDPRPQRRACAFKVVQEMLACAGLWKLRSISVSPGPLYPGQDLSEVLEQISRQLRPLVDRAAQLGCRIALENVPGHCLVTRQAMSRALNILGPDVYVCLDIGNALLDFPVGQWLEEFKSKIIKVHLSDGLADKGIFKPLLPGKGEVCWQEVREGFEPIKNQCDLFVEAPLPTGMPEVVFLHELRHAVRTIWE